MIIEIMVNISRAKYMYKMNINFCSETLHQRPYTTQHDMHVVCTFLLQQRKSNSKGHSS